MDRSEVDTWRAVAAGWERQSAIFTAATARLTARLIELADLRGDETVLELAAGPGEVGLSAAARLKNGGRLLSTDFAPEMVDVARRRGTELGRENVEYRTMDAMAIDLDDEAVDVVLCRFGVMLTPDPAVTLDEIRRVLKPDGRAAIAVWSGPERNLWISASGMAARELGLTPPPEPDAPGPFRLADQARLRSLVDEAGLEVTVLEEVPVDWHADSLDEWWASVVRHVADARGTRGAGGCRRSREGASRLGGANRRVRRIGRVHHPPGRRDRGGRDSRRRRLRGRRVDDTLSSRCDPHGYRASGFHAAARHDTTAQGTFVTVKPDGRPVIEGLPRTDTWQSASSADLVGCRGRSVHWRPLAG